MNSLDNLDLGAIAFEKHGGLIPIIAQEARTGDVLMLGYGNRESMLRSQETKTLWFFSRSRGRLWQKGETSGHYLRIVRWSLDCDQDALLVHVIPEGPTCHLGRASCFDMPTPMARLTQTLEQRKEELEGTGTPSYTQRLLLDRNLRLKKVGEEMAEFIGACHQGNPRDIGNEGTDVLYHVLVACLGEGVNPKALLEEVQARS